MNVSDFLSPSKEHHSNYLQQTYTSFQKVLELNLLKLDLDTLVIDNFDDNQIWEQIQLVNQVGLEYILDWIREHQVSSDEEDLGSVEQEEDEQQVGTDEEDVEEMESLEEEIEEIGEEGSDEESQVNEPKTTLDDTFFSLKEMNSFAEKAEEHDVLVAEGKDGFSDFEFDLDDEEEDGDQENANDIKYSDFFEAPERNVKRRKTWQDDLEDEEPQEEEHQEENETLLEEGEEEKGKMSLFEEEKDQAHLSSFERQQQKIQAEIQKLEQENMAEKEWTLKGEVSSKQRPLNSLLEADIDTDIASKPPPVITEETTKTLEELIIQRIKDSAFDSVKRKAPPKNTLFDPNRRLELNDQKSTKSLAQVYEEEYKKAQGQQTKTEKDVKLEKQHEEIEELMEELREQLDALSNYHYQPRQKTMDVQVVHDTKAIKMEEVVPASVSNARLVAPKEIFNGSIGKSQEELSKQEKTKLRQKKKREARMKRKLKEVQTGDKNTGKSKKDAMKSLMGKKNVTIVVDPRERKGGNTVGYGETVGVKERQKAEMLKL